MHRRVRLDFSLLMGLFLLLCPRDSRAVQINSTLQKKKKKVWLPGDLSDPVAVLSEVQVCCLWEEELLMLPSVSVVPLKRIPQSALP